MVEARPILLLAPQAKAEDQIYLWLARPVGAELAAVEISRNINKAGAAVAVVERVILAPPG